MVTALLYLQSRSLLNRLLRRVQRLRQPKYFVGAIVGAAYFYFYFFRYLFGFGRRTTSVPAFGSGSEDRLLIEAIAACGLVLIVVLGWLIPKRRAALDFSEAEVCFLFPAPISRRGLIHYKLLRSQAGILFTSFFFMLLSRRVSGSLWMHAAGWWVLLSTLNLHFLGASFARTRLLDRGITTAMRRTIILGLIAAGGLAMVLWIQRALPELSRESVQDPEALKEYFRQCVTSGPLQWLLYPFRLVVRPYLAVDAVSFLKSFGFALFLLGLHYVWVIRADVAFEEASAEASRNRSERIASARAGNTSSIRPRAKQRRDPFRLRPMGSPAVALLWKNLIGVGHAFTWRTWLALGIAGASACAAMGQSAAYSGFASVIGFVLLLFLAWSVLLGPQLLRQDFRQDMQMADVLKAYPMRGWQVVLGQLLAPTVILILLQWFLLVVSMLLLQGKPVPGVELPKSVVLPIAFGIGVVMPFLNFIAIGVANAAVLVFPAWFRSGKEALQGIEATGQRIIFMLGQFVAVILCLIPPTLALLLPLIVIHSMPVAVMVGSMAAAAVLAAEAAFGLMILGRFFERLDVSDALAP